MEAILIGKKIYKIVTDKKGRKGVWLTIRGRKVFVPVKRLEKFYAVTSSLIWLARLVSKLALIGFLSELFRRKLSRSETTALLLSFILVETGGVARRMLRNRYHTPTDINVLEKRLKKTLGDNLIRVSVTNEFVPKDIPKEFLEGIAFIEVHNPHAAIRQLRHESVFELTPSIGAFALHARRPGEGPRTLIFWSRARANDAAISGYLTHYIGEHIWLRVKNTPEGRAWTDACIQFARKWSKTTRRVRKRAKEGLLDRIYARAVCAPDEMFARFTAYTYAHDDPLFVRRWLSDGVTRADVEKLFELHKHILRIEAERIKLSKIS